MKTMKKLILSILIVSLVFAQSGQEYRRSAVHNANLVRTVFGNWGVIGQPASKGPRGAWLYDTNGYIGDISPIVGAEVTYYDSYLDSNLTFHSVEVCPVDRPRSSVDESSGGKLWTFEPVGGYINANQSKVAMSTNPDSWPVSWPDKANDAEDPGWRGAWNGYFGKNVFSADQESYYVMDDNNDEEFNYRSNTSGSPTGFAGYQFKPDENDPTRNGLGLEVKVRGMQWQQFLASDVIFWLYEVTNTSTTDYSKVAFGMVCGTYLGVTGANDSHTEYDDDWSFFDVQNDITYTGDFDNNCSRNPKWQGSVGLVGYAFLESPGNQYDGIDNDGDNCVEENPGLVFSAPKFTEDDFDTVVYQMNDQVVVINDDYSRSLVTIDSNPQIIHTRGATITIIPGETRLIEGNTIDKYYNVNQNVYDGVDNDLDGLIDENYIYHYRQVRTDSSLVEYDTTFTYKDTVIQGQSVTFIDTIVTTKNKILYDELNPVSYIDYFTGAGEDDPLIDEKRDDGIDNDGDWNAEFDDVGADGKDNTNDFGEGDGFPTAGEPNFDATDVDESDQIGLSSYNYFSPSSGYPQGDDEELWDWLKPGNFDVPSTIQNGKPVAGEDGDFIYGSGYFPLRAGETQRFSLALLYGHDLDDLYKNRNTVQKIYDSDYRFPSPPDKPVLTAVPGDGKVTLYWDRLAESSVDPVSKEIDFEGYKIYKAQDSDFNEVFSITNANGVVTGYTPLEQYDLVNDIQGMFEPKSDLFQEADGYTVNLGSNTGLVHSYIDEDVVNGKQYYYAVVAYDRGDENNDIYPSENTKFISVQPDGTIITDINTAVVRPQPEVAGYESLNEATMLYHDEGPATGAIAYDILDETELTDHTYRVTFNDSRDTGDVVLNFDTTEVIEEIGESSFTYFLDIGITNIEDFIPSYTLDYSVYDLTGVTETVSIDTNFAFLSNQNIDETVLIAPADDPHNYLDIDEFEIDYVRGRIKLADGSFYNEDDYVINYQYYPVYQSRNIKNSPIESETKDSDIFDGVQLNFSNHWSIARNSMEWNSEDIDGIDISMTTTPSSPGTFEVIGGIAYLHRYTAIPYPADYKIIFTDSTVVGYETPDEVDNISPVIRKRKTNFYILNTTDSIVVPFSFSGGYLNSSDIYELSEGAQITTFFNLKDSLDNEQLAFSWTMNVNAFEPDRRLGAGDELTIYIKKPFRRGDIFEFTTEIPVVDSALAENSLDNIQVVPNPYIVANNMEAPLPPAVTSGRGERRIEFRKLPTDAKVYIFTSAGALVKTLNHSGDIHNGTLVWDLKTSENLDVAFGVYFYVIESSAGKKSGKVAVIK